jgi:hypothetical protein
MENTLSGAFRGGEEAPPPDWLKDPNLVAILRKLWPALADLRNDFAHCGMRIQRRDSKDLYDQTQNLFPQLRDLWQKSEE